MSSTSLNGGSSFDYADRAIADVDGIRGARFSGGTRTVYARELLEFIDDDPHPGERCSCSIVKGYLWQVGRDPIVRFTSNGLEVT